MSYLDKYLKYKNKYTQLKKIINGGGGDIELEIYSTTHEESISKISKIKQLKDIATPTIIFDFGAVMEYIPEDLDLGANAICLSYIGRRGSRNYNEVKESIECRLGNGQIKLGIIVLTDKMKGIIINSLGLNISDVYFFDDSLDNIRDVKANAANVIVEQFLPSTNRAQATRDLITKINLIKEKHHLPIIIDATATATLPTTEGKNKFCKKSKR
jgi:hypothetical protein